MYNELIKINQRPKPFEFYTAEELWTNEHTSKKMLEYHLNSSIDASSRNINFINRSVEWISDHFKINSSSSIIDFGCGPGLYTTQFAEKDAAVTGIDFSKRSLEYAEKIAVDKCLKIKYVHQDYLKYKTNEKYDLITMIMCDFCALSPLQRKELLTKFRKLLKPSGSILLDVYSLNAFDNITEKAIYEMNQLDSFWSPDDYYCFLNTFKYHDEKVVLDKYTIVEKARTRIVYNWLQHFSETSLEKEFQENGLSITEIYNDVSGEKYDSKSNEFAVVAKIKL